MKIRIFYVPFLTQRFQIHMDHDQNLYLETKDLQIARLQAAKIKKAISGKLTVMLPEGEVDVK